MPDPRIAFIQDRITYVAYRCSFRLTNRLLIYGLRNLFDHSQGIYHTPYPS